MYPRNIQIADLMKTKISTCLALLLCMFSVQLAHAQGSKYQLKDSVNVKEKNKMRQWSYENNLSSFPAPKKSNCSIGIQGGLSYITGDVRPEMQFGFGANIRKPISHLFSLRLQYAMGKASGLDWKKNGGFNKNDALNGTNSSANYLNAAYQYVHYNYETSYMDLSLQGVFNLNNINFYKKDPKFSWYALAGAGVMLSETHVNALDASDGIYDYSQIARVIERGDKSQVLSDLRNLLDDTYETRAETNSLDTLGNGKVINPIVVVGAGVNIKLSRRIDLALEHRVSLSGSDLLDGQRWENTQTLTAKSDLLNFTTIGLNFRIGKGEDSKWFANPLDVPYNAIREIRLAQSRGIKDSDDDGVVDAMDKSPNTPKGVRVDVKGVPLDSDEDGVPDFKDQEPYSPKGAQVNKKGIALDSDNDGVIDMDDKEPNTAAGAQVDVRGVTINVPQGSDESGSMDDADLLLPMINFDLGKSDVKQQYYPSLYYIARLLEKYPDVRMEVIGHADVRNTKEFNKKLAEERATNVVNLLNSKFNISKDRFDISSKGEEEVVVKGLPESHDPKFEGDHSINRRVEFKILKK